MERDERQHNVPLYCLIVVAFVIAAITPAAATQVKSGAGLELHGSNGSWELCHSRRCLRLLRSLQRSTVRPTALPAKRQRGSQGYRRAYHYDRRHYTRG